MAVCGVSDLRAILHHVLESRPSVASTDGDAQEDAFTCFLFWVNRDTDTHSVSIKALEFLKEIYEVLSTVFA